MYNRAHGRFLVAADGRWFDLGLFFFCLGFFLRVLRFFFGKVHQQFDFGFWSAVAVMAFWSAVDISTLGLRLLLWLLACGCCTGFWYAVAVLALVCGCCFDSWSAVAVPVIL